MAKDFWDDVLEYAEHAPEAGRGGGFHNFGKLTMLPQIVEWENNQRKTTPYTGGDISGKTMEILFTVDTTELNDQLTAYPVGVTIQKTKVKDGEKVVKADWEETVLPSLMGVFGPNWAKTADGVYVETETVDSFRGTYENKKTGKTVQLRTIKFLRKFDSKEACIAARDEFYGGISGEFEFGANSEIPDEVMEQVKGLWGALGQNDDSTRDALAKKPFGNYDPETLMAKLKE